ncbi:hypothetical protein RhiJN_24832 [Ceratobasidium sp. AG-Ba]|nr:hypothetical protein RhiJN_24832 [Ceratobasidium sp. AG-Ba]
MSDTTRLSVAAGKAKKSKFSVNRVLGLDKVVCDRGKCKSKARHVPRIVEQHRILYGIWAPESNKSKIALLDTHLVQPTRRQRGSLASGSGGSSSRRLPCLASSTPSTSRLTLDVNISDQMDVESHQSLPNLIPDSDLFPLLPTVASVEQNYSDTTLEVNPHQRPILYIYTAKTAGTQFPEVHQHELLLTSRNPKIVREDRPLAVMHDYSNCLQPPNPISWVDDDPLLTSWEPPTPPEIALDPLFDLIPLPQPVRELHFSLSEGTNHSAAHLCAQLLDDELDALGDLQPDYIEEGDAIDHNPGSDAEHEYEDNLDNCLEENNNDGDEDI